MSRSDAGRHSKLAAAASAVFLIASWMLMAGVGLWGGASDSTIATASSAIITHGAPIVQPKGPVIVLTVADTINPVTASYIERGIEAGGEKDARCVVIMIDTPGGGLDPTKDIVKTILSSKVPIVLFVAPQGAHAASAGSIIVLASHIAAMSPGTNMGAAHPVSIGQKMDETMTKKVENDLAAYARSLAEKRGRDVEWAESSIRESKSITEKEALDKNVIDLIASDLGQLLESIDGEEVQLDDGSIVRVNTKNAYVERLEPTWRDKALSAIANPNIAYILLIIGIYGILFELMHPGAIYPGVIGAISLVIAFFALQMLPVNYAGLVLILIGIVLFIVEIKVISYGMLTVGGIVCVIVGSMMLISEPLTGVGVSLKYIIPVAVFTAALVVFLGSLAVKAHSKKPTTGGKGLIGSIGTVQEPVSDKKGGKVFVQGELWNALSKEHIEVGEEVEVLSVQGLRIVVKKTSQ